MGTEVKHPDPKKHQLISFVKSGIRIVSCILALTAASNPPLAIGMLAIGMMVAEYIGIYEELV